MNTNAFKGAFDGMERWDRFSYRKQLREAMDVVRKELDKTVYLYVSRFPANDYRALAKRLHISPAKLCEILRPFPHGRQPGRRRKTRTAQTNEVAVPPMAIAVSHYLQREDVELALQVLDRCVVNGGANDDGEDAYQNLANWLKGKQSNKALRDRAKYLVGLDPSAETIS